MTINKLIRTGFVALFLFIGSSAFGHQNGAVTNNTKPDPIKGQTQGMSSIPANNSPSNVNNAVSQNNPSSPKDTSKLASAEADSIVTDSLKAKNSTASVTTINCNHEKCLDKNIGYSMCGVLVLLLLGVCFLFEKILELQRSVNNVSQKCSSGSNATQQETTHSCSSQSRTNATDIKNIQDALKTLKAEIEELKVAKKADPVVVTEKTAADNRAKKQQDNNNNETIVYTYLKVADGGRLNQVAGPDAAHYRAWKQKGEILFEFSCMKVSKAINNRTSIIEPFCELQKSSVNQDAASSVLPVKPGKLNSDYSLKEKSVIKYC